MLIIEEYLKYVYDDNAKIWLNLREKILNACINKHFIKYFIPEYEFDKSENTPFLIDRETEREKLFYNKKRHSTYKVYLPVARRNY